MTEPAILHVDMDAFYASVEVLRRPELRGRPVIVGGSGDRGVVAAASYEARRHGVHSAMPSVRARRLCPDAVFLPGDHAHYEAVSDRIMTIFREVSPLVEPLSLDEAFLDVAGVRRLHGDAETIAHHLRARVWEQEGLSCAVGVARVKFIAKLASGRAKPRASRQGIAPGIGVLVVRPDDELRFLHPLPIGALWGVGPATRAKLERIGVRTVGQLAALPVEAVVAALGPANGRHLHDLANARDARVVEAERPVKSVSHEETFARDRHRRADLETELLRLADSVADRLRRQGLRGRTVSVKIRFGDFRTISRSRTLDRSTDSAQEINRIGRELLGEVDPSAGVRLLGIGLSQLISGEDPGGEQLSFDDLALGGAGGDAGGVDGAGNRVVGAGSDVAGWNRAEAAVDAIRRRFGDSSVGRARLIGPGGLRTARRGAQQWGPDRPRPPSEDEIGGDETPPTP